MYKKKNNKLNIRNALLILLIVFVSGCSATFTYNNIGWLSGFWIDDYIDLDKQQSQIMKSLVKDTRDWHRESQLPLYKADLIHLEGLLTDSPTEQALIDNFNRSSGHWQTLVDHIALPLIEVAKTLDDKQKANLISTIRDDINEEQEEYEKQTDRERSDSRLEKQIDTYNDWLGNLSKQQVTLISIANDNYVSRFNLWQSYKMTRLEALITTFNDSEITPSEFEQNMLHIITDREAFMSDELIAVNKQNRAQYASLLVVLRQTLTEKQIKYAKDKFSDMIEEIDELIAN
jgi:hypothetical protein